jgi:hypothetical protein
MNISKGRERCDRSGKVMFPNEEEARIAAKYVRKRTKAKLHAYECQHCLGWHIGHNRNIKNVLHVLYTRNAQAKK